jgi:hypothetical protein
VSESITSRWWPERPSEILPKSIYQGMLVVYFVFKCEPQEVGRRTLEEVTKKVRTPSLSGCITEITEVI